MHLTRALAVSEGRLSPFLFSRYYKTTKTALSFHTFRNNESRKITKNLISFNSAFYTITKHLQGKPSYKKCTEIFFARRDIPYTESERTQLRNTKENLNT